MLNVHERRALRDVRGLRLWAGVGRVVHGMSEKALKELIGPHSET